MIQILSVRSDERVMYRDIDGCFRANISVDVFSTASQNVPLYIESQFKEVEGDVWRANVLYPPSTQTIRFKDVEVGTAYNLRVRTVYADGNSDDWSSSWDDAVAQGASAGVQAIVNSHTVAGNLELPPDVATLTVAQTGAGELLFQWTASFFPVDTAGVELRWGASADWDTMTYLTREVALEYVTNTIPEGTWYFAAKQVKHAANPTVPKLGNYSANAIYAGPVEVSANLSVFPAYGGLKIDSNTPFSDLGVTWQVLDIFDEITPLSPLLITPSLVNNSLAVQHQGMYIINISGVFEHNSSNQGRLTYIRLWDITDAEQIGNAFTLSTGRNAEATPIAVNGFVEIPSAKENNEFRLEIGNGDAYSSVIFNVLNYQLHSIGEWRG